VPGLEYSNPEIAPTSGGLEQSAQMDELRELASVRTVLLLDDGQGAVVILVGVRGAVRTVCRPLRGRSRRDHRRRDFSVSRRGYSPSECAHPSPHPAGESSRPTTEGNRTDRNEDLEDATQRRRCHHPPAAGRNSINDGRGARLAVEGALVKRLPNASTRPKPRGATSRAVPKGAR